MSIAIKGFIGISKGDPSVGIMPSEYNVYGNFEFESDTHAALFQGELTNLFRDHVDEDVTFMSFEQHDELFNSEEE
jgi:hypothetical protein